MEQWENLGDVNYFEYGGCLVRRHWEKDEVNQKAYENTFDVFRLDVEGGNRYARKYLIDFDDITEEDLESVLKICGYEDYLGKPREEIISGISPQILAREVVECLNGGHCDSFEAYNTNYPSSWEDLLVSEGDLAEWLGALGAKEFVPDYLKENIGEMEVPTMD